MANKTKNSQLKKFGTKADDFSFKPLILKEIAAAGGWVNSHAHGDRAFTLNPDTLEVYKNHTLEEKWDLVDVVKRNATVEDYYRRMSMAIEVLIDQGVTVFGSFVDVDPVCEDRAIKGAVKAREHYKDQIEVVFANQTLKGVIEKEARKWFDIAADIVDIIGGLPKRDLRDHGEGMDEKHMNILLETGKKKGKRVHVHVDQFNTVEDVETEMLCDKTIEYGMEGMVTAIHCISLAAHPKEYREKVYAKMKKANVSVISCPVAWIDNPRKEIMQPFHNALTPVDEMVAAGLTVALGTDNICDYMVPFCNGEMWQELMLLATGNRFVDIDMLVKIATVNGRKVLGLK
jgi:cytosine/adenosine deaminase-related metal-dependent hydrolase